MDIESRRGRKRAPRMPPIVTQAVALIKQKQAQALEGALMTPDGAKAELMRAMAVAYEHAAKLVLHAFDEVTQRPTL